MPELPEVETVKVSLDHFLPNRLIVNTKIYRDKIRYQLDNNLNLLTNIKIISLTRRAKYLIIHLSNSHSLVIHLGMSGKFYLTKQDTIVDKHDHVIFYLDKDEKLVFNDARRFGMIYYVNTDTMDNHKIFYNLGVEPLSSLLDVEYLYNKFKDRKSSVKVNLMDNNIIVGIGNIYASEILFRAKINPLRSANSLQKIEIEKLIDSIKFILQRAINLRGTTLRDFVDGHNQVGRNNLVIYGKHGQCAECINEILNCKQAGRTTYYCQYCQR